MSRVLGVTGSVAVLASSPNRDRSVDRIMWTCTNPTVVNDADAAFTAAKMLGLSGPVVRAEVAVKHRDRTQRVLDADGGTQA